MICKWCFEEDAIEGESVCQNCKDAITEGDDDTETLEELLEKMD